MLFTPVNHFNWQVNNFGDTFPGDTGSLTLTADSTQHVKGSDTAALAGLAEDCWGITLVFRVGTTDATIRRQMVDILIDPAAGVGNAGSSWSVLINNLYLNSPSTTGGIPGHSFYFPIFLKAGTAIGARTQDVVGSGTVQMSIRVVGKPTRPDLVKVGHVVQTIGATTASTTGVAVTPGSAAVGSYSASLGTLTRDAWWWQLGIGSADSGMTAALYYWDIATDATAKYVAARHIRYGVIGTNETSWKSAAGDLPPIWHAPAGTDVYVRSTCNTTPDTSFTSVVYAVS